MLAKAAGLMKSELTTLRVLASSGVIHPYPPQVLLGIARTLRHCGRGPAGGFTTLALRHPDEVGLVDELGELTFGELHRRSNALAHSLRGLGVGEGDSVAVLCRNHRGFVESTVAVCKLGADVLYLNTAFAAPQLAEVCAREKPVVVIHDQEFTDLVDRAGVDVTRVLAWVDSAAAERPTTEQLVEAGPTRDLTPPLRRSQSVILTSGTTGTPKGAARSEASFDAGVALLSRLPLRRGWRTHVAAPLFHTWGWAHLNLAMLMGSTLVLRRRFGPEDCLRAVTEHRCDSLVVIPVMLQRILALPEAALAGYDLSHVQVVAASGSALPGDLATTWMDRFGDHLFNVYGSTEVAWVTIAQPEDLRAAPGTAGRPPHATVVRLYDGQGDPIPDDEAGRIFVGNSMLFEGYTGGGSKDLVEGLMATGDVGRFHADGRLFVEGRDDEMIVSGGENVYPIEVEKTLAAHPDVAEATVLGVDDEKYGERLEAFVVLNTGAAATPESLKQHVRDNLANYKVPREITVLDELPRSITGKISRKDLQDHLKDA